MKKITFILLFCSGILFPQEVKFGWISNFSKISDKSLSPDSLVNIINKNKMDFVVFNERTTKNGRLGEFKNLQSILDNLNCKYFLIPDVSELKNERLFNFQEYWYDIDFSVQYENKKFIGISSEKFLDDDKNNFTPETINWLNEELADSTLHYFLFINGDLFNSYNNYNKVIKNAVKVKSFTIFSVATDPSNKMHLTTMGYRADSEKFSFYLGETETDTLKMSDWGKDNVFIDVRKLVLHKSPYIADAENDVQLENDNNIVFYKDFKATLVSKPIWYDNKIFICQRNGVISSLDTLGNILWETDAYGDILSTSVIAENKLITATRQGDLLTLDINTGETLQTLGFDDFITSDLLVIEYRGNKQLLIEKQNSSNTAIVLGTASGKIYCYDLETLQEYWVNKDPKNFITSSVQFEDNRIIIHTSTGDIYCIDAKRGWTIWKWNEAGKDDKTIYEYKTLIKDQMMYVASSSGYVYGIDLLLGKTNWRSDKFMACNSIGLTPDEKLLLVKVYNEKLIKLSRKTGTNLDVIRYSNDKDNAAGNIFNDGDNIFVTSDSGDIYKIQNFKKSEKVFSLGGQLFLDVLPLNSGLFLISTVEGQVTLTFLK